MWFRDAVARGDNDDGNLLASAVQQQPALGDFCTIELLDDELGTVDRDEGTGA